MQLVVEISEDTFFDLKKKQNRTEVDNAILNGTPLSKGHWIPVSERLPEKGGDYLVTNVFDIGDKEPVREVNKDYYCYHSKKWLYEDENIIAWQPLPETYKAESEG